MCRPRIPVHPRACGEHSWASARRPSRRFIPARAGNTPSADAGASPAPVHPRACGEHAVLRRDAAHISRFIPARAGNTIDPMCVVARSPVHPRACGEHQPGNAAGIPSRFIPARAGNTPAGRRRIRANSVHPRACGEHPSGPAPRWHRSPVHPRVRGTRLGYACRHTQSGSSPRVRGTLAITMIGSILRSVHPRACGEHTSSRDQRRIQTVHPRACGEHDSGHDILGQSVGSSPRVRGTRLGVHRRCRSTRFIPARAGNTMHMPRRWTQAVHPRGAGNTTGTIACSMGDHRFIPARAGNTPTARTCRPASPVHPRACGEHRN